MLTGSRVGLRLANEGAPTWGLCHEPQLLLRHPEVTQWHPLLF